MSRIILKQERRKQKEFFEKKKLKSKMKLLGVSSPKSSAVSLDLLNLYVVNQISTKKDNTENVRKPVHVDITEDVKIPLRRHNIELPTSPLRTQHTSNLDDIQNRLQKQVLDSRRQHLSEKVKYQDNLSEVTELTYADSTMENEENIAGAFSACPFSSSAFWSSDCTQFSEENFNTNLMGNTWEQTYEVKMQNQPENSPDQDPWITKSQCIFRKSDTVHQELFKPLHRLDYMDSARKNPVIMTSNESENSEGIKELLFDVVKETAEQKAPQDGSDCSFLALFEDESQPIHNNPSTMHFNPFVNQSSTAVFFIDPDDGKQMTNRNYPYDTRETYPAINAEKSSVDRHLEGIFTAPEQVLLKGNNASSASYKKTSELHKTHLQDCHERQHYFIPSENKEKPANLDKIETFAYHRDQRINLEENVQNYSRKKSDDESVKESAWRQNQLFGFEEFTTAQEKECKFGVSSTLHEMEKDVESSLSSQSPSYSPRQTESCFSSSPDTSEEEDAAKKKEYLSERSLKINDANLTSASANTEPPETSHTRTVPLQPSSILTSEAANNLQEKDSILCATEEESKNHTAPSDGSSLHQALKREHATHGTRCDVWSQTEGSVAAVEKVDVATQCDAVRVCGCRSSVPSARSPAGSAGGHGSPAGGAPQPAGAGPAAGIAALSSEAEYLSLAGRRTLEVLNYIDIMKERDKQ
ncbi:regulator of DNA class I crossover intermediates 1 [Phalacrocorax aristotelis]|uniref:regulator of DNA class I crossover intermediates 1 n=1 Tax=Phalacrocorax aristotelis TaxID=126867 RepID=UPI003F4B77A9